MSSLDSTTVAGAVRKAVSGPKLGFLAVTLLFVVFAASNQSQAAEKRLEGRPYASERILYAFPEYQNDATQAFGNLMVTAKGALLGMSFDGGRYGNGAVFELTPKGSSYAESLPYSFQSYQTGTGGLVSDNHGVLYGVTGSGGEYGLGSVFELTPTPSGYQYAELYSFKGGRGDAKDGEYPSSPPVPDSRGRLFGTTQYGGVDVNDGLGGWGVAYELKRTKAGWVESVIYDFLGDSEEHPGGDSYPNGPLVIGADGSLYGTGYEGGTSCPEPTDWGCGTAFRLTPGKSGYSETIFYEFQGGMDGALPNTGLVADATGALYGTTSVGGGGHCYPYLGSGFWTGCGVVFKLTPSTSGYTESILHRFQGGQSDGDEPNGQIALDPSGNVYGATYYGAGPCSITKGSGFHIMCGQGTLYELSPGASGYSESILNVFNGASKGVSASTGVHPSGVLYFDGSLFGVASGGPHGQGIVYEATP
jgi:hypothetical protein